MSPTRILGVRLQGETRLLWVEAAVAAAPGDICVVNVGGRQVLAHCVAAPGNLTESGVQPQQAGHLVLLPSPAEVPMFDPAATMLARARAVLAQYGDVELRLDPTSLALEIRSERAAELGPLAELLTVELAAPVRARLPDGTLPGSTLPQLGDSELHEGQAYVVTKVSAFHGYYMLTAADGTEVRLDLPR